MSASAEMTIETPSLFEFLPSQVKILQDNLTSVQAKENRKEKHKLIKTIRKEILELPESKNLPLEKREDLKTAVNSWFARRTTGGGQRIRFGKIWSARMVLYEEEKDKVNSLKMKLYEKAKGKGKTPRSAFHYFQEAITKLWDELDDEEQDEYRKRARQWNVEGLSKEKKRE